MGQDDNLDAVGVRLGRLIDRWIEEGPDRNQQALAMEWLERSGESISAATVPSRLSSVRKGRQDGLRFFFAKRKRASVLLDLLGVAHEDRAELFEQAEAELQGEARARVLVVIRSGDVASPDAWLQVKTLLEADGTPRPATVVAEGAAFDTAPITLTRVDGCTIEPIEVDGLADRVRRHADGGGVVVSADWPVGVAFEQWVAFDLARGVCAPKDWRDLWLVGELPGLPHPRHTLDAMDFETGAPPEGLAGPDLRSLLCRVARGDNAIEPAARLAVAARWPVAAAASEAEATAFQQRQEDRAVEAAAAVAGIAIHRPSATEWASVQALARVGRAEAAVYRVGDAWVWLNHAPPDELAHIDRVRHEAIEAEPTLAGRLWSAVEGWTVWDHWEDPLLEDVAQTLGSEDAEALLLARRWVVVGAPTTWPAPTPEPCAVDDPAAILTMILEEPPSPVALAIPRDFGKSLLVTRAEFDRHWRPQLELRARLKPPPVVLVRVADELLRIEAWREAFSGAGASEIAATPLGHAEWELAFVKACEIKSTALSKHYRSHSLKPTELTIAPEVWSVADLGIVQLQVALQCAIAGGPPSALQDGDLLVSLGRGLDAIISLSRDERRDHSSGRAVEPQWRRSGTSRFSIDTANVLVEQEAVTLCLSGMYGGSITSQRRLPGAVHFWSAGHHARVRLVENPYTV